MAFIFAISSQKGGVAKTTTCLSLGAGMAEHGQRVLVVDLDSQADLTMAAGIDPDQVERTIVDLLVANLKQSAAKSETPIYPTRVEGLSILPADMRLAGLERKLYNVKGYEFLLKYVLQHLNHVCDTILLDCPPSLNAMTLMALSAADMVLIPAQCEYYAARGLERLLDIVDFVKKQTNPDLGVRILPIMFDQRNQISRILLKKLHTAFPDLMVKNLVSIDTNLKEAPVMGEPITLYAPESRAAEQYRLLSGELIQIQEQIRKDL